MAGDFVMVQFATPRKPEVLRLASLLNIEPPHAFGLCVMAWMWFDEQTEDGRASGATELMLDAVVGRSGFSRALRDVGWLQVREGSLVVPNFDRLMGESAKKRAKNTVRQQELRREKLSRNSRDKSATKEEKRKEELPEPGAGAFSKPENRGGRMSIFAKLTDDDLRNDQILADWFRAAANRSDPVITPSESNLLNVFGAAVRALKPGRAKKGPVAMFANIVHGARWGEITQSEEESARKRITPQIQKIAGLNGGTNG